MRSEDDTTRFSEAELGDLAALADGSLPAERRAEVEARIEANPELRASLDEQRRAVEAVRAAASIEAPPSLRQRIEEQRRQSGPAARRRRFQLFAGFATAAAAAAVIAVAVLPAGAGGPSAVEAAALSAKAPTEPAPPPDPDTPAVLDAEAEGIPYPNWTEDFGWKATGEREDEIEGRDASTVYYDKEGKRVGYTILSGDEIDPPDDAKVTEVDGEKFWTWTTKDGRQAVLWYREGKTCVMAGEDVPEDILVKLASWKGGGAVTS
jgi:hypothetical protein